VVPAPTTATVGVTNYYVSQTINNCESDRALLQVTVNPKVEASLAASKLDVCTEEEVMITLTGTAPNTATYTWNFNGASEVTGTNDAGPYTVKWSSEGTKLVTVTVANLNCSDTASVLINVDPSPVAYFELVPDACLNERVQVKTDWYQTQVPQFNWTFDGAQVQEGSGAGPYMIYWNGSGNKVVSLTLTGLNCPSATYRDTISIHQPEAKIESISTTDICTADSILFTAQPGLDYQYKWSPELYFGNSKLATGISAWARVRKEGYAYLQVWDRWGCSATDSVLMQPRSCCEVFLPNAFSPNGDGKNDVFRMVTRGNQEISSFIVVNRWGIVLFETADQHEGWDGTYKGEAQDIGTYKYYLKYKCADSKEMTEMKGDVILLR
jgi:gliding motility-associated-like protein